MTPKEEMLAYPHRDGIVSYLTHGFKGWDSPGPVDDETVEVGAIVRAWSWCGQEGSAGTGW